MKKIALLLVILFLTGCDPNPKESESKRTSPPLPEKVLSAWRIHNRVDEFGDVTSSRYMTSGYLHGTWSNSAITAQLAALVNVSPGPSFSISLHSIYNLNYRLTAYDGSNYKIRVKSDAGETWQCYATKGRGEVVISDRSSREFHNLLVKHKSLKVIIEELDRSTTYVFKIDATGYSKTYQEMVRKGSNP